MLLFVWGCSPIGLATKLLPNVFGDSGGGLAVDARIAGEANQSIVVGENERTDIKADVVTITEIVHRNFSMGLLIFAILGWILPTPGRMCRWTWERLRLFRLHKNKKGR